MALNWNNYPVSGRTQYFAGERAEFLCGAGWAYLLSSVSATGIYSFLDPGIVCITALDTDPTDVRWLSDTTPTGFYGPIQLEKKLPPGQPFMEWSFFADAFSVADVATSVQNQTRPNMRTKFTLPRPTNPFGSFLPEITNPIVVLPLTREQQEGS